MRKALAKRRRSVAGFTIGRVAFARISAVEGIRLTPKMKRDLRKMDEMGLFGSERRRAILEKYSRSDRR